MIFFIFFISKLSKKHSCLKLATGQVEDWQILLDGFAGTIFEGNIHRTQIQWLFLAVEIGEASASFPLVPNHRLIIIL